MPISYILLSNNGFVVGRLVRFRPVQAFTLAIVVIGAFLIFYGIALVHDGNTPQTCPSGTCASGERYEGLEKVTSTLGPIVAAIIGYYFGQRPAQEASSQRDLYKKEFTDLYSQIDEGKSAYEGLKRDLENIRTYESLKRDLENIKTGLGGG